MIININTDAGEFLMIAAGAVPAIAGKQGRIEIVKKSDVDSHSDGYHMPVMMESKQQRNCVRGQEGVKIVIIRYLMFRDNVKKNFVMKAG
jgi:hypothetical protein